MKTVRVDKSKNRKQQALDIVKQLREQTGERVTTGQVLAETDMSRSQLGNKLSELAGDGELVRVTKGVYDLPEHIDESEKRQPEEGKLVEVNELHDLGKLKKGALEKKPDRLVQIPLLSIQASAGTGGPTLKEEVQEYISYDREQLRREIGADPDDLAVLTVQGISMKPTLTPGDRILVVRHNGGALKDGSIYVLRNPASGVIVKRLFWETETAARLEGDNSRVPENEIRADDDGHIEGWDVLGQVVRVQQHL
ncbi:S24 family peptidase [Salinibacter altiplanensis]|uniref:S24 family peptidase n=1 Tax=Salinibacter altiplanensis TaxID=1803181 RepID=UPI000C9FC620|nr:S24 family peptidase [Salinibacter altiplanensis]